MSYFRAHDVKSTVTLKKSRLLACETKHGRSKCYKPDSSKGLPRHPEPRDRAGDITALGDCKTTEINCSREASGSWRCPSPLHV